MEDRIGKETGRTTHVPGTAKDSRLRRDREYRNEKRKAESASEKDKRLERDREDKRQKRQVYAEKEREKNRARREEETEVERESRLERDRNNKRLKRMVNSSKEKENGRNSRENETETEREKRESRLKRNRENKKKRREEQRAESISHNTRPDKALEREFEDKMKNLGFSVCRICNRREMTCTVKDLCAKCSKKPSPNIFTRENRMDPGEVPSELKDLSPLEELLIAKVHPVVSLYKTKGQQLHYSGHVINFPQDVKSFCTKLPNIQAATGSLITIRKLGQGNHAHTDFIVRGHKVRNALVWLKANNEYYRDIQIDEESLQFLPRDGNLFETIQSLETKDYGDDEPESEGIYTTNVPHIAVQNQAAQINQAINGPIDWPEIQDAPIDEFRTAGYIVCAFPTLFPYGDADLRQGRLKDIGTCEYFQFLMSYYDGRFARHSRFPFFALNSIMRWTALNQGKVFVKKSGMVGTSIQSLREIMKNKTNLTKNIMFYGSAIRGTKAYWFKRCGELLAMVDQLGTPTIFFTLSAADLHWPDLFRLLRPESDENAEAISHSERIKLMCANPLIVATFFEERGTFFIECIMKKKFHITDFWYRFEWQHRGSPHIHGLFWIEGAPTVDDFVSKSEEYRQELIHYFDQLVSAWNPDVNLPPELKHPCQIRLEEISDEEDAKVNDYTRLLNKVQRHTICSANYCLRINKSSKQLECRFKFPKVAQSISTIVYEKGLPLFRPKRNDDRLNVHNNFITALWRANTDFQPIMSRQAVINYIAKYASKSEPQSETYKQIMDSIVENGKPGDSARKAVQQLLMKSVAERDFSSQEVAHVLMGYPLYHSSRQFVSLSTKKDGWQVFQIPRVESGQDVESQGENFLEKYSARPEKFEAETLWEFARNYYKSGKNWVKRRKSAVVQVFPKLSFVSSAPAENKEEYFRQKVLLFTSWRCEDTVKELHSSWENAFNVYNLECFLDELNDLEPEDEEFEEADNDTEFELEEFMVAARDGPHRVLMSVDLGNREIDLQHDWNASYGKYQEIENVGSFLSEAKKEDGENKVYVRPDVTLTDKQQMVVDLLAKQIEHISGNSQSSEEVIKRVIVQGKGGSGKSTLIQAMTADIANTMDPNTFLLMAPTGSAAVNIGGSTIHSTLNIGINGEMHKLEGQQLREFQLAMEHVKFIIIDEYSMVGCRLLGKIDQRCREAKPDHNSELFGGLHVYFLGDIKQLPPVMDRCPFARGMTTGIGANGRNAYYGFQKCFTLGDSQRQAGTDQNQVNFREVLDRLSLGQNTEDDWLRIDQRTTSKIPNFRDKFKDALRLFPTNELTVAFNEQKLRDLGQPVARIQAKHNIPSASYASSDLAQGLLPELLLAIGSRIMLRSNLWTGKGLVNGTLGTVHDIIYRPGENPSTNGLPISIMVKWDNYSGPLLNSSFPLCPVTRHWKKDGTNYSRTQFPIVLAWAVTIHKSQGMTLTQAVIDIGAKEFSAGLSYVALSRVKSWDGLALDPPCSFNRLKSIGQSARLRERIEEESRLALLH